jgi:hypothetical protein
MEPDQPPNVTAKKDCSFKRSVDAPASQLPQSSTASRFPATQAGFFILSQSDDRPEQ